jgi:DNA-binding CsgD family transcriptional regulator
MLAVEEIDEMWVLGTTAAEPFDQLSIQERQLLKWRYVDGERSSEISLKINEHPNTIREHLTKIKNKVRDLIIELEIDEYAILLSAEKVK